jgi:hypothetical protein
VRRRALRLGTAVAFLAAALTAMVAAPTVGGAAATSTFLNDQFNESSLPPPNWQVPTPPNNTTWAASCPPTTPTNCAAVATIPPGTSFPFSRLLFNPPQPIPADLQNPTLSFTSDFSPDATTSGDHVLVAQAPVPGDTGDFNPLVTLGDGSSR